MPRPPFEKLAVLTTAVFAVAALLSGCTSDKKYGGGGVVDGGGGGDVIYTSKEDVLKAVKESWNLISGKNPGNPLLIAYWQLHPENRTGEASREKEVFDILAKILSGPVPIPQIKYLKPEDDFTSPSSFNLSNLDYLADKNLDLKENDLCTGPGDHKYLASVTRLTRDGEICVSISGLMKLPSGSLRTDLLALFAHEIAHLNGADERLARRFQAFFLSSAANLTRSDGDGVKSGSLKKVKEVVFIILETLALPLGQLITQEDLVQISRASQSVDSIKVPNPYLGPQLYLNRPLLFPEVRREQWRLAETLSALGYRLAELKEKNGQLSGHHWELIEDIARQATAFYALYAHYLYEDKKLQVDHRKLPLDPELIEGYESLHQHYQPEKYAAKRRQAEEEEHKRESLSLPEPPPPPPIDPKELERQEKEDRRQHRERMEKLVPPLDDPSKWIYDEE